ELCRQSNDYILQSVARYPQRLLGFISLPLPLGDTTLREVERCLPGGIKGLGELRLDIDHFTPRSRAAWEPVIAETRRQGLILLLHASEPVGHTYTGKGKVTPGLLYKFMSLFPGIKTVCAHWGGGLPFYSLMPEVASALKDAYFDSAASSLLYQSVIFHHVSQLVGTDRILFGSDFPLMSQRKALDYVNSIEIAAETKARLLGLNAQALLGTNQR
ncbi:MAG: amidohydrolase family protein, partial [Chloroflexota bacterium]